jgi:hypothetical protein
VLEDLRVQTTKRLDFCSFDPHSLSNTSHLFSSCTLAIPTSYANL